MSKFFYIFFKDLENRSLFNNSAKFRAFERKGHILHKRNRDAIWTCNIFWLQSEIFSKNSSATEFWKSSFLACSEVNCQFDVSYFDINVFKLLPFSICYSSDKNFSQCFSIMWIKEILKIKLLRTFFNLKSYKEKDMRKNNAYLAQPQNYPVID